MQEVSCLLKDTRRFCRKPNWSQSWTTQSCAATVIQRTLTDSSHLHWAGWTSSVPALRAIFFIWMIFPAPFHHDG